MEYIIEVEGLRKQYPEFALKDVSFKIPGGCIMGLIGENGAGKSTTLKAILDLIHIDGGKISVFGKSMKDSGKAIREDIGVVLDGAGFHASLNITNIGAFMSKIYKKWDEPYYERLCERFSLSATQRIQDYSTGMRMKLLIATAMAHRPKLLILDEATSGLDPVVRDEILDMLLEFIQDEEHSVLISSHIISDLEKVADYITFIHKGEIFLSEEKDEIMETYGIVHCKEEDIVKIPKRYIVGVDRGTYRCDVLVNSREDVGRLLPECVIDRIRLEDVLLFKVKGER